MKNIFISTIVLGLSLSSLAYAHEDGTVHQHEALMSAYTSGSLQRNTISTTTTEFITASSSQVCRKFSRGLALGSRGNDVKELQEMLYDNGYLSASSTGYFGPMTKAAVVKFQKEGGLNPSGYFGELSRKQHEKRCGEGKDMGKGGDDRFGGNTGTSSKLYPCPLMACKEGAECLPCGGKPLPPVMGSGTPPTMGTSTKPCMTMFDPMSGKPCKSEKDDHKPPMMGTGTPPTGIMCTMEARMCPNGTMMPRDNMCGWHPEQCGGISNGTSTKMMPPPISVPAAPKPPVI